MSYVLACCAGALPTHALVLSRSGDVPLKHKKFEGKYQHSLENTSELVHGIIHCAPIAHDRKWWNNFDVTASTVGNGLYDSYIPFWGWSWLIPMCKQPPPGKNMTITTLVM